MSGGSPLEDKEGRKWGGMCALNVVIISWIAVRSRVVEYLVG